MFARRVGLTEALGGPCTLGFFISWVDLTGLQSPSTFECPIGVATFKADFILWAVVISRDGDTATGSAGRCRRHALLLLVRGVTVHVVQQPIVFSGFAVFRVAWWHFAFMQNPPLKRRSGFTTPPGHTPMT